LGREALGRTSGFLTARGMEERRATSAEGFDFVPDVLVDGDSKAEIFVAEAEGLFAGVAWGLGGVGGGCSVESFEEAVGDAIDFGCGSGFGCGAEECGVDREKEL